MNEKNLETKECRLCHQTKILDDFYFNLKWNKFLPACKECEKIKGKLQREKTKELARLGKTIECKYCHKKKLIYQSKFLCYDCILKKQKPRAKIYHQKNRKSLLLKSKFQYRKNIQKNLWQNARIRAKKENIPFNIEVSDVIIPKYCPIFGIKLMVGNNKRQDNSPSLDKIIPRLGYVKGNVKVISWKANNIKNIGTAEEHEMIAKWIRQNTLSKFNH